MRKKRRNSNTALIVSLAAIVVLLIAVVIMGVMLFTRSSQQATEETEDSYEFRASVTNSNLPAPDDQEEVEATTDKTFGMDEVPYEYLEAPEDASSADQQGTVVHLSYESAITSLDGDTEEKTCVVYLPYGYTDDQQYDVFYLMHGMGGSNTTFLGDDSQDGGIKKVLDHAIQNGEMKPMIVVAPDLGEVTEYDDHRMDAICIEIRTIVMPLVESTYSTYAQTTDAAGFKASREHRAFGGFSMGGCITWRMLRNYTDCFKYYIPCSMIVDFNLNANISGTTSNMVGDMQARGISKDDFLIYCATGSEDYTGFATKLQVEEFEKYEDLFVAAEDDFSEGNLMFRVFPDRTHRFFESFSYFYNGLKIFFPAE